MRRLLPYAFAIVLVWGAVGWLSVYGSTAQAKLKILSDVAAFSCTERKDAIAVAEARDFAWTYIDNIAESLASEGFVFTGDERSGVSIRLNRGSIPFVSGRANLYFDRSGCLISPQSKGAQSR